MIVYAATAPTGETYIGRTVYSLERRKRCHKSSALSGHSSYAFHEAIRRHGFDSFEWEILEFCKTEDELNNFEKHYIKVFNTIKNGFNMTHGGVGVSGSEEVKNKISKSMTGSKNHRFGTISPMRGKKTPKEITLKMSAASKGKKKSEKFVEHLRKVRTGWKLSPETRAKISKAHIGKTYSEERIKQLSDNTKRVWAEKKRLNLPFGKLAKNKGATK